MIRVLLVDDQVLIRSGLRVMLEASGEIEVLGEACDGRQAVELTRQLCPDVVLMDIRMPVLDGIAVTAAISADSGLAGVHILVLTTFDEDTHVFAALRSGAAGFLAKEVDTATLQEAVRVVAAGQALLSPAATRALIEAYLARPEPAAAPTGAVAFLTDREREVLALFGVGLSNEEIAAKLVLSPATARTHVSRIMTKLGARDRTQAVVAAYESGLVRPGQR